MTQPDLRTAIKAAEASLINTKQPQQQQQQQQKGNRPPPPKQQLAEALIKLAELDKHLAVANVRIEGLMKQLDMANKQLEMANKQLEIAQTQVKTLQSEYTNANKSHTAIQANVIAGAGTLTAQAVQGLTKTAHTAVQIIVQRVSKRETQMKALLGPAEALASLKTVSNADVQTSLLSVLNEAIKMGTTGADKIAIARARLDTLKTEIELQRSVVEDLKTASATKDPSSSSSSDMMAAHDLLQTESRKLSMLVFQQDTIQSTLAKFTSASPLAPQHNTTSATQ